MKLGNDPSSALVLTALEKSVLQNLADSLGEPGKVLRTQIQKLRVVNRSHSGVGFVTKLEVTEDAGSLSAATAGSIRPVYAHHPQLQEPAEFMVQLKAGRLAAIEAFCCEGMWPTDEAGFSLKTARVPTRD